MAAQESALRLQVEAHQAVLSQDAALHRHTWQRFVGFGFAGLMLTGLVLIGVVLPSSSEKLSGPFSALAFRPAVPGLRPHKKGGLGTHAAVPVMQLNPQGPRGSWAQTFPEPTQVQGPSRTGAQAGRLPQQDQRGGYTPQQEQQRGYTRQDQHGGYTPQQEQQRGNALQGQYRGYTPQQEQQRRHARQDPHGGYTPQQEQQRGYPQQDRYGGYTTQQEQQRGYAQQDPYGGYTTQQERQSGFTQQGQYGGYTQQQEQQRGFTQQGQYGGYTLQQEQQRDYAQQDPAAAAGRARVRDDEGHVLMAGQIPMTTVSSRTTRGSGVGGVNPYDAWWEWRRKRSTIRQVQAPSPDWAPERLQLDAQSVTQVMTEFVQSKYARTFLNMVQADGTDYGRIGGMFESVQLTGTILVLTLKKPYQNKEGLMDRLAMYLRFKLPGISEIQKASRDGLEIY